MLLSRKMIKGVIMSTGKMKVLVVSGFLGAGKTTWIKMLIDHNPVRGKVGGPKRS